MNKTKRKEIRFFKKKGKIHKSFKTRKTRKTRVNKHTFIYGGDNTINNIEGGEEKKINDFAQYYILKFAYLPEKDIPEVIFTKYYPTAKQIKETLGDDITNVIINPITNYKELDNILRLKSMNDKVNYYKFLQVLHNNNNNNNNNNTLNTQNNS